MSIRENTTRLNAQIADHCKKCGRDFGELVIIAASKYTDAIGIQEAYDAGLRNFGENRIQDAIVKMQSLPEEISWHMIGHLQSNKVAKAVGAFELIHSVDSEELAIKISRTAAELGVIQSILLEVNTSGELSKFGLSIPSAKDCFRKIFGLGNLNLLGFMTMAALSEDEREIRASFRALRVLRNELQDELGIVIPVLSMGMTNDWRIAVEEGATHLRIGSAFFLNDLA